MVAGVRAEDPIATEDLYRLIARYATRWAYRQLGNYYAYDGADCIQDVFVQVTIQIRKDNVQHPEALIGYIRTITKRLICAEIGARMQRRQQVILDTHDESNAASNKRDSGHDPEHTCGLKEQDDFVDRAFQELAPREKDILRRFYLEEQPCGRIMCEMNLSETQYRLLKSRAKAKFGEAGKRLIAKRALAASAEKLAA
jgi:RNA polymerase sigma factor (sigma-70 family)